ncbi:17420_t:CDS:2, partial [Dentiscutata heterogama]
MSQPTERSQKLSFKKTDIFYIFLIFVPVGYIVNFLSSNDTLIFIMNFLAIISSAKLLRFANNELSHHLNSFNETLEDILDVAFNNLVELIITIVALVNGKIRVVQAALLGSILSHTLLILGFCFLVGGIKILEKNKLEEEFNDFGGSKGTTVAQMTSSVLTLACISLVLPAAFGFFVDKSADEVMHISYGTSIVLLVISVLYLCFRIKTHKKLFARFHEKKDNIDVIMSLTLFAIMIVNIVFLAQFLIKSIEGIVASHKISQTFIGLILLPIVGHCDKYISPTYIERNNHDDKCANKRFAIMVISVRSSIQTALIITPLLVILGWIINKKMSLSFTIFETICLVVAIMLRNYLFQ